MAQIAIEVRRVARRIDVFQDETVFFRHIKNLTVRPKSLGLSRHRDARWCNGSTADSESACHGSSPCRAASFPSLAFPQNLVGLLFAHAFKEVIIAHHHWRGAATGQA